MSTERKIKIFETWFYWASIININEWIECNRFLNKEGKSIDISNYSFVQLHEFAKEI